MMGMTVRIRRAMLMMHLSVGVSLDVSEGLTGSGHASIVGLLVVAVPRVAYACEISLQRQLDMVYTVCLKYSRKPHTQHLPVRTHTHFLTS